MKGRYSSFTAVVVSLLAAPAVLVAQTPVGTAFSYQGQLKKTGEPLNDTADFQFTLWDAATDGNQIGSMVPANNVTVADGLFTVTVDFGADPFTANQARWLQVAVRSPAGSGEFTTLDTRQPLTPTPFSLATRGISVDANGNVGLGTATPEARLDVKGNVIIRSADSGDPVVELGEGLDLAEGFDVSAADQLKPGTVVIIDPEHPGQLAVSRTAYDTKVAGIVAGANGLGSGVRLGTGRFDCHVALAGRVYCNVDATEAGIEPGDLLTTSGTPGYAMKATDHDRSRGAILGKAMQKLEKGRKGQILVLVSLQ